MSGQQDGPGCQPQDHPQEMPANDAQDEKKLRTKKAAEQTGAITDVPPKLALPTRTPYHNTLTTFQNPFGYIQPLIESSLEKINIKDGVLYYDGMDVSHRDLSFLYDRRSKALSGLDMPVLRAIYSAVLNKVSEELADMSVTDIMKLVSDRQFLTRNVTLSVPEFMRAIGHKANLNSNDSIYVIAKLKSYDNAVGITDSAKVPTNYQVLDYAAYDSKTNTVLFTCPYLNWMIITLFKAGMRTDSKGQPRLKRNGKPIMDATHSYLVHTTITSERNKKAVNLVCAVVRLIEQTGSHTPNIYASTLVKQVPDLDAALEATKTGSDKNRILRRAFTKMWELLKTQTDLELAYPDIQFSGIIPTYGKLATTKLEFPHNGKTDFAKKAESEANA